MAPAGANRAIASFNVLKCIIAVHIHQCIGRPIEWVDPTFYLSGFAIIIARVLSAFVILMYNRNQCVTGRKHKTNVIERMGPFSTAYWTRSCPQWWQQVGLTVTVDTGRIVHMHVTKNAEILVGYLSKSNWISPKHPSTLERTSISSLLLSNTSITQSPFM